MRIEVDDNSGFCFGVVTAIEKAEEQLEKSGTLYCLGDIAAAKVFRIRLLDASLQLKHHGACGVYDPDVVLFGNRIG